MQVFAFVDRLQADGIAPPVPPDPAGKPDLGKRTCDDVKEDNVKKDNIKKDNVKKEDNAVDLGDEDELDVGRDLKALRVRYVASLIYHPDA